MAGHTVPVRLRLSRAKGFDLQALSLATNGLPAVNVARPSRWGNPFVIGETYPVREGDADGPICGQTVIADARDAVDAFRDWTETFFNGDDREALEGRNLACWCAPDAPCHADVLLRLANPASPESEGKP